MISSMKLPDWRLRFLIISTIGGLYLMVSSLVSVTQMDARSLTERRILQQDFVGTAAPGFQGEAVWAQNGRLYNRKPWRRITPISWCRSLNLKAAPGPVTALASFPGSGNTWLRYLLQQATGIHTGSVYRDLALQRNGFPMETVGNGSVLVVKTHEWGMSGKNPYQAAILLLRDPGESILAEFNRRSGGHIGHASREKFEKDAGKLWTEFARKKSRQWEDMNTDWILNFSGPLLILTYSKLLSELKMELHRCLNFLGISLTKEQVECAINRQEGIYRRKADNRVNLHLFTPEMEKNLQIRWNRVMEKAKNRMEKEQSVNPWPSGV